MKIITLKEAIERGFIYQDQRQNQTGGFAINKPGRVDDNYFDIESIENLKEYIDNINEPSVFISDDDKKVGIFYVKIEETPRI